MPSGRTRSPSRPTTKNAGTRELLRDARCWAWREDSPRKYSCHERFGLASKQVVLRAVLTTSIAATLVLHASKARADSAAPAEVPPLEAGPSSFRWDPAWTHAGVWDYVLSGAGATALGLETILLQNKSEPPRWIGPILFDQAINDALRTNSTSVRNVMETGAWVLWFALVGYPYAVDIPYVWVRYGKRLAWDLFWQDTTTLSLSGAVDIALRDSFSRLRPWNTQCLDAGGTHCFDGPEATRSFPSGHVSETTTATALICTQHLMLRLYGAPWDAVACASAIAAAAATATFKMVADDHWATDVLGGAALGIGFGWGVPVLMHLHGHADPGARYGESSSMLLAPVPIALSHGAGLGLSGMF
jgi:membrane-associated phospholipid phosphatase